MRVAETAALLAEVRRNLRTGQLLHGAVAAKPFCEAFDLDAVVARAFGLEAVQEMRDGVGRGNAGDQELDPSGPTFETTRLQPGPRRGAGADDGWVLQAV